MKRQATVLRPLCLPVLFLTYAGTSLRHGSKVSLWFVFLCGMNLHVVTQDVKKDFVYFLLFCY